ncbi:MAG: amino acid adenylation domain-containing protein [Byssovorax sp.]
MSDRDERLRRLSPEKRALLERRLAAQEAERRPSPIPRRTSTGPVPLSPTQRRLWHLARLAPEASSFLISACFRLVGPLDRRALGRAVDALCRRHEALRTRVIEVDGEPLQEASAPREGALAVIAITDRDEASALAAREAYRPFDLDRDPLFRARLLALGAEEHVLVLTAHHLVSDGSSTGVILRELSALYRAFRAGEPPPLGDAPLQLADVSEAQRSSLSDASLAPSLAYHRAALDGAPALLDLPLDFPRPAEPSHRGAAAPIAIPAGVALAFAERCRADGMTLFSGLLALFQALLHRFSGQDDLLVGTPLLGRSRSEVFGVVGPLIDTAVLRARFDDDPSFTTLGRRAQAAVQGALAHADLPFSKLVEALAPPRSPRHAPLFQVLFRLQEGAPGPLDLPAIEVTPLPVESGASDLDLSLSLTRTSEGLSGALRYDTEIFSASTAARMASSFGVLLAAALADPDRPVAALPLVSRDDRRAILSIHEDTAAPIPDGTVIDRIDAQVARRPDAIAVSWEGHEVSYAALREGARQIARRLRSMGAGRGARVGIHLDRSPRLVAAVLGVLAAGAAYVPLDPAYPEERLRFMIEDADLAAIVSEAAIAGTLPPLAAPVLVADDGDPAPPADRALPRVDPADPAYVIYTSGSTGRPKGVVVPHRALSNFLAHMARDPGLSPADRLLAVTTLSFDIAGLELLLPLSAGATIELAPRAVAADGALLRDLLHRSRSTVIQATPSTFRMLLDAGFEGGPHLRILSGGERLPDDLAAALLARAAAVYNLYGPTETTIWSTMKRLSPGERVTIGRPIANTRVYVLDRRGQPQPFGVPGEIVIGGAGVALGYHGNAALTAARFVLDPFAAEASARMYRTGDLGLLREDGSLEHLGRLDAQIKLRGVRIEPGEIEAALCAHPAIGEAAVVLGPREQLVAAVTLRAGWHAADAAALTTFLSARLPAPFLPSIFVTAPALPRTPNGKLDRRAVLALVAEDAVAHSREVSLAEAPRSPIEERLAALWAEALGAPPRGIDEDFFAAGGHSLLGARLLARIRAGFGVELTLRKLFGAPTIRALAVEIAALGARARPLVPAPGAPPVLDRAQERLWFLEQLAPGTAAYHIPVALRLRGPLDEAALDRALVRIVTRHEVLRTAVRAERGAPVALLLDPPARALTVADVSEEELPAALSAASRAPFALDREPLLRPTLFRVAPDDHALLLLLHHIAADGFSIGLVLDELSALYRDAGALPPLPLQYADLARDRRDLAGGGALAEAEAQAHERLDGAPRTLDLPLDHPRPAVRAYAGDTCHAALSPALVTELAALALRARVTPFMVLLAAFEVLLGRYTGQRCFLLGTPVAGRSRVETEGLIGLFVNTLVLRADLAEGMPFLDLLARVREDALDAFAGELVPFERLVEALAPVRSTARAPLVEVLFSLQNAPRRAAALAGLTAAPIPLFTGTAKLDLSLAVTPRDGGLDIVAEYDRALFLPATIERLLASFEVVLRAVVARPDASIDALPILSAADEEALLACNRTERAFPDPQPIPRRIAEQAARTPDLAAVRFEGRELTYAALLSRARSLAHLLRVRGVGKETIVGIFLPRGLDLPVALLAVLLAGGAYLPLDPSYPPERLRMMIEDAAPRVILAEPSLAPRLPRSDAFVLTALGGGADSPEIEADLGDPSLDDLAYVIFTSGSTGRPKGVMVTHRAIHNRLAWGQEAMPIGPGDRVLQKTPLGFDVSVWELFWPLQTGACLVLARPEGHKDPGYLVEVIERERITLVHFVPSMLRAFLERPDLARCRALRRVLASGEALPPDLAAALLERLPSISLHNLYGPTEAAVEVTAFTCVPGAREVPIGHPIANCTVHLLDAALRPVPFGVTGELYLGGVQVARGYVGRPDLTAERFLPDPFSTAEGARLYRTSDLGRRLPDGSIAYLGRADRQIKLRGVRIELGEIEAAIAALPGVREAAVEVRADAAGEGRLVAYVAADSLDPASIRRALARSLPDVMIPAAFVRLDRLPIGPSGKLDRGALPAADLGPRSIAPKAAPEDALQALVASMWERLLGVARVGPDDNFFDLGGHSLLAARLVAEIERDLGVALPLTTLFHAQTVSALGEALRAPVSRAPRSLIALQPRGEGPPFFCVSRPNVNALGYVALSRRLGPDQPVFVLQSSYREEDDGRGPYAQAEYEAIAADYIAAMRSVAPEGPYLLGGMCEGAHLAFEMTRQLHRAGQRVALLVMLDAWPVENTRSRLFWYVDVLQKRAGQKLGAAASLSGAELYGRLRDKALSRARRMLRDARAEEQSQKASSGEPVHARFHQRYFPGKGFVPLTVPVKITVLRVPRQPFFRPADPQMGWASRTTEGVEVFPIQGDHDTFLREPHVASVAERISACIARVRRERKG